MNRDAKVLVVDDEESIRITFQKFISDIGFHVETVSSIKDAKAALVDKKFDVAVIDYTFPGNQKGLDLIALINKVQPSCQPILVSGYPLNESEKGRDCRVFSYICKPLKKKELCSLVEQAAAKTKKKE